MPKLSVYIPINDKLTSIVQGSGIVGQAFSDELTRVKMYYEGNLYQAENLNKFSEKVMHASGRLVSKYPTIAFTSATKNEVVEVGTYDTETHTLTVHTEQKAALKAWALAHQDYHDADWLNEFGSI